MLEDRAESHRQEEVHFFMQVVVCGPQRKPGRNLEAGTLLTGSISTSYSACFCVQPGSPAWGDSAHNNRTHRLRFPDHSFCFSSWQNPAQVVFSGIKALEHSE